MSMYYTQTVKKLLDQYKYYHHTDNDSISSCADLLKILIQIFLRKRQVHKECFDCIVRAPQMLAASRGKARYLSDLFYRDDTEDKNKYFRLSYL